MKSSNRLFAISALILVVSAGFVYANKDYPITYYPSEYKALTATNWPEIQVVLNKALSYKDANELQATDVLRDVQFTLSRLMDIQWSVEQRQIVVDYLEQFITRLLVEKKFIAIDNKQFEGFRMSLNRAHYLPIRAIRVMARIDADLATVRLDSLWQAHLAQANSAYVQDLRFYAINALADAYRSDAVAAFFGRIKGSAMGSREIATINHVLRMRALMQIDDQQKAWEFLWAADGNVSIQEMGSINKIGIWQSNISDMQIIFGSVDISIPVAIAENVQTPLSKRYAFLYVSAFLANGLDRDTTRNQNEQKIIIERIILLSKLVFDAVVKEMPAHRSSLVEECVAVLKKSIQKPKESTPTPNSKSQ